MLNLASETDPDWAERAAAQLDEVLLDHAHCERKAAGAAVNLLFRYPEHEFLQAPLAALAREELAHYEEVLSCLARRGVRFERQKPSAYGGRLHGLVRQGEPERLLDVLLVGALIEARSCERFQLLATTLTDPELAELYHGLLASEARHHAIYLDVARRLCPETTVRERLDHLAAAEAAILREPSSLVRLHS